MSVERGLPVDPGTDLVPARSRVGLALTLVRGMWRLPSLAALGLVRVYQLTLSPMLGPACRFYPSCSHYACACLRDHGLVWGSALTVRRIVRCQPFHPGGFDPPPPPRAQSMWARVVLRGSSVQDESSPRTLESRGEGAMSRSATPASTASSDAPPSSRGLPVTAVPPPPSGALAPNDLLRGAP